MIDFEYPDGATPIDPDEAGGLLLTHITTQGELNRWEQNNIIEALAWLEKTKPTKILNEQFIIKLHKKMFGNVWKWAGKFRRSDKNIGISWDQIPARHIFRVSFGYMGSHLFPSARLGFHLLCRILPIFF